MCKIELYKNLTKWSYFLLLTHVNVRLISDPLFSCSSLSDKSDFDRSVNFVMDQIREPGFFIFRTPLCGGPIVISLFARNNVYGAYIYILSPIWLITTKCLWAKSVQWHHAPKMKVISDMCKFLVRTIFPPTPFTQSV